MDFGFYFNLKDPRLNRSEYLVEIYFNSAGELNVEERRKVTRSKVLKSGAITFESASGISCIVRNLSTEGALLETDGQTAIPDHFSIIIKPEMKRHYCQVIWRSGVKIGIKFVDR